MLANTKLHPFVLGPLNSMLKVLYNKVPLKIKEKKIGKRVILSTFTT